MKREGAEDRQASERKRDAQRQAKIDPFDAIEDRIVSMAGDKGLTISEFFSKVDDFRQGRSL